MPYCLLPLDGGVPIVLEADDLVIGRDPDCDHTIRGCDTVSRRHHRLSRSEHYFAVFDLNSRNGVRVNGHKIHEPASLKPGDYLRLGGAEFVLAMRSQEAIEALTATAEIPAEDTLGVTQPIQFFDVLNEEHPAEFPEVPAPESKAGVGADRQSVGSDGKRARRPVGRRSAKKERLRDIGQKSWDAIVAFERSAPVVRRKPPRKKKRQEAEPESKAESDAAPPAPADRAVLFGYTTRAAADSAWDYCRLGLTLIHWAGLAVGFLVFLTWLVPTVPLLVESMRMTAETLSLQFGAPMVVLGALPVLFCVALREIAPGLFWPAVCTIVLGLAIGQFARPANGGLAAFSAAMLGGVIVLCVPVLAGACLTCLVPGRSRLRPWAGLAAGGMLAVIVVMTVVAMSHFKQISGLTLPVGRPPGLLLEGALIVTGIAAPLLLLMLMRAIGNWLKEHTLVDSVNTCTACVAGAGALAPTIWYLVVSAQMTGTWADVFLLVSASGVNLCLFWTAQSAGFTRDSLR